MTPSSLAVGLLAVTSSILPSTQESHWEIERKQMVRDQIEGRGVVDVNVIRAMRGVPRHLFVPEAYRVLSYGDFPLPIGEGQTISQPYMVALMTEVLALQEDDRVLEIGTGSGYQAAVLDEIVQEVYTIEIIPSLALRADSTLTKLGYTSIRVKTGDGYMGWEEYAPFDAIVVTCAPPSVPEPLTDQLRNGGRMVLPIGEEGTVQTLVLIEKIDDQVVQVPIIPCVFVPMRSDHIPRQKE